MAHPYGRQAFAVSAAGVVVALAAGGCCHVPRADRYFDRGDAFITVNGFVYAIEIGEWGFAYDSLTERSKKLFTFSLFKLALRFNAEVPEIEVPIRDLIVGAERKRFRLEESPRRAEWEVIYAHPNGRDTLSFKIIIVKESLDEAKAAGREEQIWLIDFDETLRGLGVSDIGGAEVARK